MTKKRDNEKLFRKKLNKSQTFFQAALKPPLFIPGLYVEEDQKTPDYSERLFQDSKKVFKKYADQDEDPGYLASHKIRITSKKSRRRFDINLIFSYIEMEREAGIPEDAELVFETETEPDPGVDPFEKVKTGPDGVFTAVGPGVTEEEKKLIEEWEKENPQTFEKAEPTVEQLLSDRGRGAKPVAYYCKPGTPAGQPGGCDKGYDCIDNQGGIGTCKQKKKLKRVT